MAGFQWLDWFGDGSLIVVDIGLACCALEFEAATSSVADLNSGPIPAEVPVVVVVSGTVTDRLAPAVASIIGACGTKPTVISFGACASSGGPYWDSYSVTKGIDQLVEVDLYLPGCPPPPQALREALDGLRARGVEVS